MAHGELRRKQWQKLLRPQRLGMSPVTTRGARGCRRRSRIRCPTEHKLALGQWGVRVLQNGPWPIRDEDGNDTDRFVYDNLPTFSKLCDLCADRQAHSKDPMCVHHCQAACLKFGPVDELVKDLDAKPMQYLWVPPDA